MKNTENHNSPLQTEFTLIYEIHHRNNSFLKNLYSEKLSTLLLSTDSNIEKLAKLFIQIADSNIELAEKVIPELKLQHYNDAAVASYYALQILKDKSPHDLQELEQEIYQTLNNIQISMVKICDGDLDKVKPITNKDDIANVCHKDDLQNLRNQTSQVLGIVEKKRTEGNDELYISLSATMFKDIANGMEKYLAKLYQEAEAILGNPPCSYAIIGLGSMALRQMTPYSDLECGILTENDNYRQSEEFSVRNYFKNLSYLVQFMIINLGETTIPFSSYGVNLDKFIPQAVNFDLGGKTPVGRIEQDKPYELIQTVDGMLRYLKNESHSTEHIDKNLAAIMQKVCFVYGEPELVQSYKIETQRFLEQINTEGQTHYMVRAIKGLWEGVEEFDYTKSTQITKKIEGNLKQFSPDLSGQGRLFEVKQEIYRLPDRLIYNLGLIYGVQEESSWDTLERLCELGKISTEGSKHLKKALTFATNLRLKIYDHYGSQKETMDFNKAYSQNQPDSEELIEALSKTFKLKNEDLKPDGALFKYYKVVLPLHKKLEEFCTKKDIENRDSFFANEEFYSSDSGTVAEIHLRLLQYEEALEHELQELEMLKSKLGDEHPAVATLFNKVGNTYNELGKHELALQYQLEALAIHKKLFGEAHHKIAINLNNVGCTYGTLGKHELALQYQLEALAIHKKLFGEAHHKIATNLNNIGTTYGELGKYELALQYQLEALGLFRKFEEGHPIIAVNLNNVGTIYGELGKHELALQYQLEALGMYKKLLSEVHPAIATNLNNIGTTYEELGKHELSLQYKLEALVKRRELLGEKHPTIVASLNNVGCTYGKLDKYELALQYKLEALKMQKELLGEEHPDIAKILGNVGKAYSNLDKHDQAIQYQLESLEMYKKLSGEEHPDIARILINIGEAYSNLRKPELGLNYQLEAFEMQKRLLGEEHPDLAISLNSISHIYRKLGKHELTLQYRLKALEMQKKLLGEEHPDIAMSLNNVGSTYGELGMHKLALQYEQEALELFKKLGNEHPNLVTSLDNIGSTYQKLGEYELALQYQLEALEMQKKLLSDEHPDLARSLNNVGTTYDLLGIHKLALQYKLKALELFRKLGEGHPSIVISLNNISFTCGQLGEYKLYLQYKLEALEIQKKLLGGKHPDLAMNINNIGSAYAKLGEYELALQYKLEALERFKKSLGEEHPNVAKVLENVEFLFSKLLERENLPLQDLIILHGYDINIIKEIETQITTQETFTLQQNVQEQPIKLSETEMEAEKDPLTQAIVDNDQDMISALILSGADPNQPIDDNGNTIMHVAYSQSNLDIINLLIQNGGNINCKNSEGKTPLHCLLESQIIKDDDKIIKIQGLCGLDITIKDNKNKTVLDYAVEYCSKTLASIILSLWPAFNDCDGEKATEVTDNTEVFVLGNEMILQ